MRNLLAAILVSTCFAVQWAIAEANGAIQGKVSDVSGAAVLGAVITIEGADGNRRTTVTDENGTFQISSLPLANYNVKISAFGLSDWTAADMPATVNPESNPLLAILQVAPEVTTVTVGVSPQELATEQLNHELKQRALGIIPNYYVTYERHPAPLSPTQKMHLALKTLLDPTTFAGAGITAGIQQEMNSYHQFGQGAKGFAKRFGAAYGTAANGIVITSVVANSVFHQDPRYFYSGQGTKAQRARYALKSAFLTKGDNGKWQPPYATVTGMIASAELSQVYLPGARAQYTLLGRSFMFHFGGLVGLNLAQEFLLKKLTSNTPRVQLAGNRPVLREGTPVALIAVEGFSPEVASSGRTVSFVLARDLSIDGKVLAKTGDIASGQVGQVTAGNTPVA